ncbi:specifically androgen-regulated gene protein-like [Pelobates fuscus]|uniref:specifically androgen-regulated gene protein-like n=1 Tax=Pelobates fuscus TaxID=191477 RepID=UPI002FE44374
MDGTVQKKEASNIESTLESEDFFCRLTDEEKECLQYLLETINSLEAEDDDENANVVQENGEHFGNATDPGTEMLDQNLRRLGASINVSDKTEPGASSSKMKIMKSLSEDVPGFSITVSPETGKRSTGSHPSHMRKFDTIMKSGVNVQELRALFIHQQTKSSAEDNSKGLELPGAPKLPMLIECNPKSARLEALQKLGFLKTQSSSDETQNPHDTHHPTDQTTSVLNGEINQNVLKGSTEAPTPMPRKSKGIEKKWPP